MFTAADAQAKVIEAREVAAAVKKAKERAEKRQTKKLYKEAEERLDESLAKALEAVEEAAEKPLSTVKFEVGHRQGSACPRTSKLTELVMEKLSDLGYRVRNTSSDSKEQTTTIHYQANVWRYEIQIQW
jgi:tRNA G26 N,N-dimethylase Trm1